MKFSFGILAILFFASCAHQPVKLASGLKPEAFWSDQNLRADALEKVTAKLSLRYRGAKQNVSGSGKFWSDGDKQLRFEIRDPLGREQFVVGLQGKNFTAFYPRNDLAYLDSAWGERYVEKFLGLPIRFSDLRELWLGLLPSWLERKEFSEWKWDESEGAYSAELVAWRRGPQGKFRLWIDGEHAILKKLRWELSQGTFEIQFSDVEKLELVNKVELPFAYVAVGKFENTGHRLEIEWQDAPVLGQAQPSGAYSVPLDTKVKKHVLQ